MNRSIRLLYLLALLVGFSSPDLSLAEGAQYGVVPAGTSYWTTVPQEQCEQIRPLTLSWAYPIQFRLIQTFECSLGKFVTVELLDPAIERRFVVATFKREEIILSPQGTQPQFPANPIPGTMPKGAALYDGIIPASEDVAIYRCDVCGKIRATGYTTLPWHYSTPFKLIATQVCPDATYAHVAIRSDRTGLYDRIECFNKADLVLNSDSEGAVPKPESNVQGGASRPSLGKAGSTSSKAESKQ